MGPEGLEVATHGVVRRFDEDAGHGTVTSDAGDELFFHCTAIADGSRTIQVGRRVTFAVEAGRLGRWEAADLVPSGG